VLQCQLDAKVLDALQILQRREGQSDAELDRFALFGRGARRASSMRVSSRARIRSSTSSSA